MPGPAFTQLTTSHVENLLNIKFSTADNPFKFIATAPELRLPVKKGFLAFCFSKKKSRFIVIALASAAASSAS